MTFKTLIQKLPATEELGHAGLSELITETETKKC